MDRWSQRFLFASIAASVVVIYIYPLALSTPLLDPDEGLHAAIAQEMVETGDYVVPRVCGRPFLDKPILYFAAQAASLKTFGMNETAVRLPGFLFALVGCLTTALLTRRLFDAESAIFAILASLTLVLPLMLAQFAVHDIALVPWINLFVLCFWEQEQAQLAWQRWRWVAAMALCVALALLTKGLLGIAVVSSGIGLYAILSRTLSWQMIARCSMALVAGGVLASPWFLRMELEKPGYLYYYFIQRHFLGFVTEGQEHGRVAWYYYVGPVLGGAMPWLLYAAGTVLQSRYDAKKKTNLAVLLLACWFVGGYLFLSLAGSKLLTYSLPLFPPLAILSGVGFRRLFNGDLAPLVRTCYVVIFRLCSLFGVFAPVVTLIVLRLFFNIPSPIGAFATALLAATTMAVGWVLFERGKGPASFAIGMLWFPLAFLTLIAWPVQRMAEMHSQRSLEKLIAHGDGLPEHLILVGERVGSFMFYLSPKDRQLFRAGRVREAFYPELNALIPPPAGVTVAVTEDTLSETGYLDEMLKLKPIPAGRFYVSASVPTAAAVAERPAVRVK